MARTRPSAKRAARRTSPPARPSALLDTRIVYCGDCLDQLRKLPDPCVDLIYIDPPFDSNSNYEVFRGETKEKAAFKDRHASTQASVDYMRPRCVRLQHVLRATGIVPLPKLPPTSYHAFTRKNCIASVGSGTASCKGNV